ncbi:MAG: hypothetical protein U0228_29380 [Myxococcaceae bacterium]
MKCPVCEHEQAFGVECDVCGKALGGLDDLGPPPVMLERLEGLEQTLSTDVGEVAVERVGELEVTRFAEVAAVPNDVTPDLQPTAGPAVGDVPVERMQDMAVDRVPDDGSRTPLPAGPVTCRYCRNVQASGSICDRCGMRLPQVIVVPEAVAGKLLNAEDLKVRCRSCGAPAKAGEKCGDCGRDVPFPDA